MIQEDKDKEWIQSQVKLLLTKHQAWLQEHFPNAKVRELLSRQTKIFDQILKLAFPVFAVEISDKICLIALGSYGRGEVCPHSDLDLLILHQDLSLRRLEDFSNRILSLLWDQKIKVGHSIRTIEQCLRLIEKDYSVLTSLLDARLVVGNEFFFDELKTRFEKLLALKRKAYFSAKMEERKLRQMKFRKEIWLTEPYLMEGTGGLRDWHLIKWLSQACLNLAPETALLKFKIANVEELKKLRMGLDRLFRLRFGLHRLTGEKTDHLRIDYQEPLAKMLALKAHKNQDLQDALLAYYFSGAELIAELMERLNQKLKKILEGEKCEPSLQEELKTEEIIRRYSLSSRPSGTELMEILTQEQASETIQLLKRRGLLKAIFPELDKAFHLGQRDGYHIFTVGWHSLRCLERIEQFSKEPEFGDDPEINWRILKLAGLTHDLGKGTRADHIKQGTIIARRLARKFHLGAEGKQLEFLVGEHLLLNHYAQQRDFYEPKATLDLCRKIKDRSRLKMLYLLTCADIQAVSETSFTSWKADLLKALYHWLLVQIEKQETVSQVVQNRLKELRQLIKGKGLDPKLIQELEHLPTRYLLGAMPEKLIEQMSWVQARSPGEIIIKAEPLKKPRLVLTIICDDHPGLFSELSGVISSLNYNILSAEINTLKGNTALDLFLIEDLVADQSEYWTEELNRRKERLEQTLKEAIVGKIKVPELVLKKRGLFKPRSRVEILPEVKADQESSESYTILEVQAQDQPGLLYKITRKIFDQGLDIHFAKISTRSEKVFDVFYLRDPQTRGKAQNEKISQLVSILTSELKQKNFN